MNRKTKCRKHCLDTTRTTGNIGDKTMICFTSRMNSWGIKPTGGCVTSLLSAFSSCNAYTSTSFHPGRQAPGLLHVPVSRGEPATEHRFRVRWLDRNGEQVKKHEASENMLLCQQLREQKERSVSLYCSVLTGLSGTEYTPGCTVHNRKDARTSITYKEAAAQHLQKLKLSGDSKS